MLPAVENCNCYEYLKKCTGIYDDVYMMQHFGVKYRKSEMFRDIDALSSYFQNELGLRRGDVFTLFTTTTMQGILSFYALNQIGVIANIVHPLMSPEYLKKMLRDVNAKGVMILDLLSKDHVKTINDSGLPCIVCSSSDYAQGIKKHGTRAGEAMLKAVFPKFKNAVRYRDVVQTRQNFSPVCDNANDIAMYLNGGGTTGKSKTIKLTSRATNELVQCVSDLDEIHIPGEEAEISIVEDKSSYCNAKVLSLISKSPDRRESPCRFSSQCGGCPWIELSYDRQVSEKERLLKELFSDYPDAVFGEPVTGPEFGYRCRARFQYSVKNGKPSLGFCAESSNTSIGIKNCPIADKALNDLISNPPRLNAWELANSELSCISTDDGVLYDDRTGWITVGDRRLPVSNKVFFPN